MLLGIYQMNPYRGISKWDKIYLNEIAEDTVEKTNEEKNMHEKPTIEKLQSMIRLK